MDSVDQDQFAHYAQSDLDLHCPQKQFSLAPALLELKTLGMPKRYEGNTGLHHFLIFPKCFQKKKFFFQFC